MNQSPYVFQKTSDQLERDRLQLIEGYHDPFTRRRLRQTGLAPKWNCVEVGPGAGSIMRWMARKVGPQGQVTAVELNPRFIAGTTLPNVTLIHGDISRALLPADSFHLAHGRFTFIHTPRYKAALKNIFQALRPGGWLVLEEPDFSVARVVTGPKLLSHSVQRINEAIEHMFLNAGLDPAFGITLPGHLQKIGFNNLTVENATPVVKGGSPMAMIMQRSANLLGGQYLATGRATKTDLTRYTRFAEDPRYWAIYHGTVAVMAQKPKNGSPKS